MFRLDFPKYFQNQNLSRQLLGGKIVAGLMILHMLTQPVYDIFLFNLAWQEEFPLHMCDMSSIAMIIFLLRENAPKLLFHCAYFCSFFSKLRCVCKLHSPCDVLGYFS